MITKKHVLDGTMKNISQIISMGPIGVIDADENNSYSYNILNLLLHHILYKKLQPFMAKF